jgi:hypothetical protein
MCCDTTVHEAAHPWVKVLEVANVMAAMVVKGADGALVPHDEVHLTHFGSFNGFVATVTIGRVSGERPAQESVRYSNPDPKIIGRGLRRNPRIMKTAMLAARRMPGNGD